MFKTAIASALRYKESPKDDVFATILDLLDGDSKWRLPTQGKEGAVATGSADDY